MNPKHPQLTSLLETSFFERDVVTVARELVGVELFWEGCSGIIVETEAYAVEDDAACHTASRPSAREFVEKRSPGTAYVYLNYGMYWLLNLLVKGGERDGLILIRALEPGLGVDQMKERRQKTKLEALCSVPGKLSMALGISGEHHGVPLVGRQRPAGCGLRLPEKGREHRVVEDIRVGISKAVDYPWRFLAEDHPHLSVARGKVKVSGIKNPPLPLREGG